MEITLGLTDRDIQEMRKIRVIARENCRFYQDKEDSEDGITGEEGREYSNWIVREAVFDRICELIDNRIAAESAIVGKEDECLREPLLVDVPSFLENVECREPLWPYIRQLTELITSNTCMVEKDSLRFPGRTFRNKKLLPFNGSRVQVSEYEKHVSVFTLDGKYIVSLYKNRFRSQQPV